MIYINYLFIAILIIVGIMPMPYPALRHFGSSMYNGRTFLIFPISLVTGFFGLAAVVNGNELPEWKPVADVMSIIVFVNIIALSYIFWKVYNQTINE